MRTYNVIEIANLLSVDGETVRRYIRSGMLKATQTSKKTGYVVDELDLLGFIKTKPKYRRMMCSQDGSIGDVYAKTLNDLLTDLINERDRLNDHIDKIRVLLEGS